MSFDQTNIAMFFYCLARITAAMISAPVISSKLIPARIKLIIVVALTTVIFPIVPKYQHNDVLSLESIILIINQFAIGLSMGIILQITFQIFVMIGELVSMQSGLAMAVMNDPLSQASVPIVSQLFLMLVSYLFLVLNGHLVLYQMLAKSFTVIPIDFNFIYDFNFKKIVILGSWMFFSALKVAIPMMIALLLVQVAMGVMTKAAPQLNIFTIGFPLTMIIGLIILWLKSSSVINYFDDLYKFAINFISHEILGA